MWLRLFAVFLGLAAGFSLHLGLITRALSYLPSGMFKPLFALTTFILLVGGLGTLAYLAAGPQIILAMLMLLLFLAAVSLGNLVIQRQSRGSPPVERLGLPFSLLKPVTTTDLQVLRYELPLPGWRGPRLRIAHLSDFHFSDLLPYDYYLQVIQQANRYEPDLVFLTGDFVTESRFTEQLPALLRPLQSRLGVFAIFGNHDYWASVHRIADALLEVGVRLLGDGSQRLALESGVSLLLVGCQGPWSGELCGPPPARQAEIVLALSHTADNIYRLSEAGVAATFSGHYHGGQVCLPFFGPPLIPSRYGRRFARGHFLVGGTHLFVSAGVGAARPPLRLYCPPDFLIVDLVPALAQA